MKAQDFINQVESKPDATKVINELMKKWYPEVFFAESKAIKSENYYEPQLPEMGFKMTFKQSLPTAEDILEDLQ